MHPGRGKPGHHYAPFLSRRFTGTHDEILVECRGVFCVFFVFFIFFITITYIACPTAHREGRGAG